MLGLNKINLKFKIPVKYYQILMKIEVAKRESESIYL